VQVQLPLVNNMADVTISDLSRVLTTNTSAIIPITIGGVTYGVPVSAIITANGSVGTNYMQIPAGTAAQRTGTPLEGAIRYNSTSKTIEYFNGTVWSGDSINATVLLVGGGGGGGCSYGDGTGGGGGGGVLEVSKSISRASIFSVTVGQGGAEGSGSNQTGQNGGNSVFLDQTALGGGGGAAGDIPNGRVGASGGGGWVGASGAVGSNGTPGQGFKGGDGLPGGYNPGGGGGGGGGAGGPGSNGGQYNPGGNGGIGKSSLITGTITFYGGGGGGGSWQAAGGTGGNGGGGNGGSRTLGTNATAGINGLGGGGGGFSANGGGPAGKGGSGVVIIKYEGVPQATGGSITQAGGFTIHTFTASGTFTVS